MISFSKIIWSLINNSLELVISITTLIFVAQNLSPDEAGQWVVFTTTFALLEKFRDSILQATLFKLSSGVADDLYWKVTKASFSINFSIEIFTTLIVTLLGLFHLVGSQSELFSIYAIYSIPWCIYRWQGYVLQGQLKIEKIFRTNVILLFCAAVGFLFIFFLHWRLKEMIYVLGITSALACIQGLYFISFHKILKAKPDKKLFIQFYHLGKYGFLREIVGTVSFRINLFLTAGILNQISTAMLGFAQKFTQVITFPNDAVQRLVFPKACELVNRDEKHLLKELFENLVSMLLAGFIPIALIISLIAKPMIVMLSTKDYVGAAPLLAVMLFTSAIFPPFGNAFGSILNALGELKINTKVVVIIGIINIAISAVLIRTIGLYGSVISPLISETIGLIWTGTIMYKVAGINYINCFKKIPESYVKLFYLFRRIIRGEQKIFS